MRTSTIPLVLTFLGGIFPCALPGVSASDRPGGDAPAEEGRARTAVVLFVSYRSNPPLPLAPTEVRLTAHRRLSAALEAAGHEVAAYDLVEPILFGHRVRSGESYDERFLFEISALASADRLLVSRLVIRADRLLLLGRVVDTRARTLVWAGIEEAKFDRKWEGTKGAPFPDWEAAATAAAEEMAADWVETAPIEGAIDLVVFPATPIGEDFGQAPVATHSLLCALIDVRRWRLVDPALAVGLLQDGGYGADLLGAKARSLIEERFSSPLVLVPRLFAYGAAGEEERGVPEEERSSATGLGSGQPFSFGVMTIESRSGLVASASVEYVAGDDLSGLFGVTRDPSLPRRFQKAAAKLVRTVPGFPKG